MLTRITLLLDLPGLLQEDAPIDTKDHLSISPSHTPYSEKRASERSGIALLSDTVRRQRSHQVEYAYPHHMPKSRVNDALGDPPDSLQSFQRYSQEAQINRGDLLSRPQRC